MADKMHTEIELKLRVPNAAALTAIAKASGGRPRGTVQQVNHFFDTPSWRLRGCGFGLRLRDEDGRWFLTAKGPALKGSSARVSARREEEVELPGDAGDRVLAGLDDPLDVLARHGDAPAAEVAAELLANAGDEAVALLGTFENRRTRVDALLEGHPVTLELDETTFPGGIVHHEVEVEVSGLELVGPVGTALDSLLASIGVASSPGRGKAARFFRTLKGLPIR